MTATTISPGTLYEAIMSKRAGAHFCKMDLHTHTPASECSSFALPAALAAVFPGKGASATRQTEFLTQLAGGANPFSTALASPELTQRPHVAALPTWQPALVQQLAAAWLHEVACLSPVDLDGTYRLPKKEFDQRRKALLQRAIWDLGQYVKSLLFPEEFILRCYLEELELVALTDHNHPGYLAPRLPQLGTWYAALSAVNQAYLDDLRVTNGANIRAAILARLHQALQALDGPPPTVVTDETIAKNHHGDDKAMRGTADRETHIQERLAYWNNPAHPLRPLTLLPGVEITVSDIHLLAIFPPEWYVPGRIGDILREIGIAEAQWGRGFVAAASASVQDTITRVHAAGGIAIPAHANSDFKGLFPLFPSGLALYKVLEHPALLATELTKGTVLPKGDKGKKMSAWQVLEWLDSDRSVPDRARPLCFIRGSDAHECRIECDGTGEDLGARYTNIKIDLRANDTPQEVFRSLRLALMNGANRVIEYPTDDGYNYLAEQGKRCVPAAQRAQLLRTPETQTVLLGLVVSGKTKMPDGKRIPCYADDLLVRFSPYLNCLVGNGGKSTVIRHLCYAFGVLGFMENTPDTWLPESVTVFWRGDGHTYGLERQGRSKDPAVNTTVTVWQFEAGAWTQLNPDNAVYAALDKIIEIWPVKDVQTQQSTLSKFEDDVIADLTQRLCEFSPGSALPLLINQPDDIFNAEKLFSAVLAKPMLKSRQILWSTGSPNVPTALDAEKIIITEETEKDHMQIRYAGDLHEDEIRTEFLNQFEGGWQGFVRRMSLYGA